MSTAAKRQLPYVTEEALWEDPFPILDRLREESPLYWHEGQSRYLMTRWEDCERVAVDTEFFGPELPGDTSPLMVRAWGGELTILSAEGDAHRDLRAAVDPPLRPRAAQRYANDVLRPIAREQIERLRRSAAPELMSEYFEPVSVLALAGILGLRGLDSDTLRRWFSGIVSGLLNESMEESGFAESDRIHDEIRTMVAPLIDEVTANPDGSTLSHMVHSKRDDDHPRTIDDLLTTLNVYIAGGMQEPGHGAGSTMYGLLTHPDQLTRVVADPALIPRAVNEGLRWIAPIGTTGRRALKPVTLGGVDVEVGDILIMVLLSANRDPAQFSRPDEYDIDRPETKHLAFGGGSHICSGFAFGREVMRVALEELLSAFPDIRLDPERDVEVNGWQFRAPRVLHVLLGDSPA